MELQGGTMQCADPVVLRLCDGRPGFPQVWLVGCGWEGRKVQY